MDEAFYIKKLHQGDEDAFRIIFERYVNRLNHYAANLLKDEALSKDLVQDAFIKVWERRQEFDSFDKIKSFLYIVLRNSCFNVYKHDKVIDKYYNSLEENDYSTDSVIPQLIESEVMESLHHAIKKLPPRCQKVMNLSYFRGLQNQEVAKYLKISINTVKTQKRRGIKLLQRSLEGKIYLFLLIIQLLI